MLYKILERFGRFSGESWASYVQWRRFDFTTFDSVDGMLRGDLFEPRTEEDWANCVNENFQVNLITNLEYAQQILGKNQDAELVGVEVELEQEPPKPDSLLGFDIIDGDCHVSLLTNWGVNDLDFINRQLQANGLIGDFESAWSLRNYLREHFPYDSHARGCHVWAVHRVSNP